ncbi:MAG TPA: MFS transporter [Candidatus Acidoferrales bacterium]|nr:MFS transporter [Candidatus Acidoferrales bacterium]
MSTAPPYPPQGGGSKGRGWLNRNVLAIGFADLMADFNYEMVLAVLPLFITSGLGAPVSAVGVVEGVADGSSALVKLWSGWYSDRIAWRKGLAVGGYAGTVFGLGLLVAVATWPQVVLARGIAWVGRGLRQPIRSAMLAGSVGRQDFGKAFGFHEALDTLGALAGPAVAFALLVTGSGFQTVFWVALIPGLAAFLLFGLLTRDPRTGPRPAAPRWVPLPGGFWRLIVAVSLFGAGNFAPAFFTLRAAEMLRPELSQPLALSGAVAFYLAHNAVGSAASFPGGWLADRFGKVPVLAAAYASFALACGIAIVGHGPLWVALLALPVGVQAPLVVATEGSLTSSLVADEVTGTAFGVLHAVNGVGDLVSSLAAGWLWAAAGAAAGLGFGGALGLAGALLLLALRPARPTPAAPASARVGGGRP